MQILKYFSARGLWKAKSRQVLHEEMSKKISLAVIVFKLVCVDDKFSGLFTP